MALGWLAVTVVGLFVPLMDNDSAHHANIALRMYLTGDYVNLVDYDGPYLDKPHLHFWLAALSYHVFGVTGFAYKLPSFIFSLIGIWAVYRSGVLLFSRRTGEVAGAIYATSASFLLAMNDVRMDAILTAAVAVSVWQLLGFFTLQKIRYVLGAALGMAIGFCTKGHIGILIPILFALFYAHYGRLWKRIFDVRVVWGLVSFAVLISPVVYCYYLQYDVHPELVVRGKNNISGVQFILWEQSLGRYSGEMGGDAGGDKLFFFHTFLWVFAPWSIIAILSLFRRGGIRVLSAASKSILLVLLVFGILVGFSSFKLPHYLNVILPLSSLWVGDWITFSKETSVKFLKGVEWLLWLLIGALASFLLIWWFPDQPGGFWVGFFVLFTLLFYVFKRGSTPCVENYILRITASVILIFWFLNAGFYPKLLNYQGGNVIANRVGKSSLNDSIYSLSGFYSSSFYFYTGQLRKEVLIDSVNPLIKYILLDEKQMPALIGSRDNWVKVDSAQDYEITKLSFSFLSPETRDKSCTRLFLLKRKDL